jgi:hypothetical protein
VVVLLIFTGLLLVATSSSLSQSNELRERQTLLAEVQDFVAARRTEGTLRDDRAAILEVALTHLQASNGPVTPEDQAFFIAVLHLAVNTDPSILGDKIRPVLQALDTKFYGVDSERRRLP